jgi:diguanylate cyclase (GGDEF)-like protein
VLYRSLLVFVEVVFITLINYYMATSYFSLDVLYCLPVIQTARSSALQSQRNMSSPVFFVITMLCALTWSGAEAAVSGPGFPISAFIMNVVTRALTFTVIGRVIAKLWKEREYSRKDVLTGLANRQEFLMWLNDVRRQSDIDGKPYSLVLFNIDNFRRFNEKYGHAVGDEALKLIATTMLKNSRNDDTAARIGSDEFILLLPDADRKLCDMLGPRIVQAVDKQFKQRDWDITLSYGNVCDRGTRVSIDELIRVAGEEMKLNRGNVFGQYAAIAGAES